MNNWQEIMLGEICDIEIGGTPSRSEERYWWKSSDDGIRLPWVSISDMKRKVVIDTKESITELGASQSNCKHIPKGTLLMSFKLTIGRLAFAGRDLYTNEAISAIKPIRSALPEFLYYGLQQWNLTGDSDQAVKGVTLNKQKLQEIPCLLPPLPEQKKIIEILSGVQNNINAVEEEIVKIENLEKCLMSSFFSQSGGGDWRKVPVSDIGRVVRGASPRPKGDPRYYGGRVPRLMVADVTRDGKYVSPRIDYLTEAGAKLSRPVPAGTLTIVCSGVVGVPSILSVDACIHDGFLALVDISPECTTEYLYYFFKPLQQLFDSSATHGGIFTNLTTEIMKEFPVFLPPLSRQAEIVKILNSVEASRNSLLSKRQKLVYLFEGISSDLLSGRQRVSI